jgi:hypothetical protein
MESAVATLSDEELECGLHDSYARLCAEWRTMLGVVAEHDCRGLWSHFGSTAEAPHLVAALSLSWRSANDWVRAAHGLERNPRLAGSFAAGLTSFDQVVALVGLAEAEKAGSTAPLGPFDDIPGSGTGGAGPEDGSGGADPDEMGPDGGRDGHGSDGATGSAGSDGGSSTGFGDAGPELPGPDGGSGAATGRSDDDLVRLAGAMTAAQLAQLARHARRRSREEADRAHQQRRLRVSRDQASGRITLDGALFGDAAETVWSALDAYLDTCKLNPTTGRYDPTDMRLADGLVAMATAYLSNARGRDPRPTVVAHVDARVLLGEDGWAETTGWSPLSAETVRRLACFCKLNVVADGPDGTPVGVGRARRLAPDWLADLVRHRDGGCRIPGCERRMFTQIHHIRGWDAKRGRTDLAELIEACTQHHHLFHDGGWTIEGDANGELTFTSPLGVVLRSLPGRPPPT